MKAFKFGGALLKKNVEVSDDGVVTVSNKAYGGRELKVEDIKAIYLKKATMMENGTVFLSSTGGKVPNPQASTSGFMYTRKQEQELNTFIEAIQHFNPEIPIEADAGVQAVPSVKALKKVKVDKHAIKCPKCKSTNVEFLDNKRKGFSMGKAVGGAVLTGGIGTLAGFAGKKGKDRWHCKDCGRTFEK